MANLTCQIEEIEEGCEWKRVLRKKRDQSTYHDWTVVPTAVDEGTLNHSKEKVIKLAQNLACQILNAVAVLIIFKFRWSEQLEGKKVKKSIKKEEG